MTPATDIPTVRAAVRSAGDRLREAGFDTPQLDAELLACHVLGMERSALRVRAEDTLGRDQLEQLDALVQRRLVHEPVQYILGRAWFRRLELAVDARVLIPRPETELLVEWGIEELGRIDASASSPARVLDLCTGSGAIGLAIAEEAPAGSVRVVGADLSVEALDVARANLATVQPPNAVELVAGDLYEPLGEQRFDVVLSNPPYVPHTDKESLPPSVLHHEPHVALFVDGEDETALLRQILAGGRDHLVPGGLLAVEIGMGQEEAVRTAFEDAGYHSVEARRDLQGIVRTVGGRLAGGGAA